MALSAGDRVLAWEPASGKRWLLRLEGPHARKVPGLGVLDATRFIGLEEGAHVQAVGKTLVLLRPTPADLQATLRRKAQIIGAKDASRIAWELGLAPGMRVLESGVGSASATIVMASAVTPGGQVVVQELREDFAGWAQENLEAAGLADAVTIRIGDLTQGPAPGIEGAFDAVLLDQPAPWRAIGHLMPLLAPGARIACYTPQVSQMEQAHRELARQGFAGLQAFELIERGWEVKEFGSRPSFGGLGHTAFLVTARWPGRGGEEAGPPAHG